MGYSVDIVIITSSTLRHHCNAKVSLHHQLSDLVYNSNFIKLDTRFLEDMTDEF